MMLAKLHVIFMVCTLSVICVCRCLGKSGEEWKTRVIYQILTDRFRPTGQSPSEPCINLRDYCGGTFKGIIQRLDYIQGLGANAIWISPFVENTEGGYHGYWAKDIYSVNPHFGSKQDLQDLVAACHARDVWVMMDVVANHMGPPFGTKFNFTGFVPFDQTWHYHDYCQIKDWLNQTEVEICRLATLPDLNQSVPFVRDTLLNWIENITAEYGFDGYRVDTAVEVPKWFWTEYRARAGVYLLGEANNGDRTCYTASYQGPLPAVLNFPLYWAMRRAFNQQQSMKEITDSLKLQRQCFSDVTVLGLFVDNHDLPRFLNLSRDTALLANAVTYVMFAEGIPIVYYGTEQEFYGGNDPCDRESLWPHQTTKSSMYQFISQMASFRKTSGVDFGSKNQRELYVDSDILVFCRGQKQELLIVVTNVGGSRDLVRHVTGLPYSDGTVFQNIFNASDSITVQNSSALISLERGAPKVYYRQRDGQVDKGSAVAAVSVSTKVILFLVAAVGPAILLSMA